MLQQAVTVIREWESANDIELMLVLLMMGLCGGELYVRNEQYVFKRLNLAAVFPRDDFRQFRARCWQISSSAELETILRETSGMLTNCENFRAFLNTLFAINSEAGKFVQNVFLSQIRPKMTESLQVE